MKKFITVNEACKETGLSQHMIRGMIKEGMIPHIKSGNRYLINYELMWKVLDEMSVKPEKGIMI